jgi:hypothetical protein
MRAVVPKCGNIYVNSIAGLITRKVVARDVCKARQHDQKQMHYYAESFSTPERCCNARHHLSPLCKQQQSTGVVVKPVQHVRLGIRLVPWLPLLLLLL